MMYEDLVKRLRNLSCTDNIAEFDEAADAIEEMSRVVEINAKKALKWAEDAKKATEKTRWIPVTERLPKQGKRYLVVRYDHVTKTPFIDILWHDAHDLWWNRLYKGQYNVTHWQPLPEMPKEG